MIYTRARVDSASDSRAIWDMGRAAMSVGLAISCIIMYNVVVVVILLPELFLTHYFNGYDKVLVAS